MNKFTFTYKNLESDYRDALAAGYEIITCKDYFSMSCRLEKRTLVNRVDVDFSLKKARKIWEIFERLGIKGTFFIRLHAPEYNPFSFENFKILKAILNSGHEIGYHSEVIDQSIIWGEDPEVCLLRDLAFFEKVLGFKVCGVASHGGMTGLNNLDFWKNKNPQDYGLLYEAYKGSEIYNLFDHSFYISDSEWTHWKCYKNGKLCNGDYRCFSEHLVDEHALIYLLIHPDTFYENHFYE
jgi:hypothetical protein